MTDLRIAELDGLLLRRSRLLSSGMSERALYNAVEKGELRRVSPGRFVEADVWNRLHAAQRHLLEVLAAQDRASAGSVFSSVSAAALLGLPLLGLGDVSPRMLLRSGSRASSTPRVSRSATDWGEPEIVEIYGMRATGIERTVEDLARFCHPELAIGAIDAAIRMRFPVARGAQQDHGVGEWLDARIESVRKLHRRRGVRQAVNLLSFGDGRAESPLESVARFRFLNAGYLVESQVRVAAPHGRSYFIDLELVELGIYCEIDGRVKYSGQSAHRLEADILAEKQRVDWIVGTTGKRLVRLGYDELRDYGRFDDWRRAHLIPAVPQRPLTIMPGRHLNPADDHRGSAQSARVHLAGANGGATQRSI